MGSGELEPGASYSEGFLKFTVFSSFEGVSFGCDYFADAFPDQGELEGEFECFLDDGTFVDNGKWFAVRQ